MKNRIILTTLLSFGMIVSSFAQQDPKAKEVLTELSRITKSEKSLKATFETTLSSDGKNMSDSRQGKIISSGNNYHIYFDDMEVISNGESIWTVLNDANEVQLSSVPESGDIDDYANPSKIATIWEKGFNYKYEKEEILSEEKVHVINLYPQNPKSHDFHTIKLYIRKDNVSLAKIIIKGKDGTDITYDIKTFEFNPTIAPKTFTYSPADHPEFEIIDLR